MSHSPEKVLQVPRSEWLPHMSRAVALPHITHSLASSLHLAAQPTRVPSGQLDTLLTWPAQGPPHRRYSALQSSPLRWTHGLLFPVPGRQTAGSDHCPLSKPPKHSILQNNIHSASLCYDTASILNPQRFFGYKEGQELQNSKFWCSLWEKKNAFHFFPNQP